MKLIVEQLRMSTIQELSIIKTLMFIANMSRGEAERIVAIIGNTWQAIADITDMRTLAETNQCNANVLMLLQKVADDRVRDHRTNELPDKIHLVNLTPHAFRFHLGDQVTFELPSEHGEARATSIEQTELARIFTHNGAPRRTSVTSPQRFTGVTVPPFNRNAYDGVIVSMATAQTLERTGPPATDSAGTPIHRRLLVFAPGKLVRDAEGKIVGASTLELYDGVML